MSGSRIARALRIVLGLSLIVLGVVGLVLPVVPGIALLAAGALAIGLDHPLVRPITQRLRRHGLLGRADTDRR